MQIQGSTYPGDSLVGVGRLVTKEGQRHNGNAVVRRLHAVNFSNRNADSTVIIAAAAAAAAAVFSQESAVKDTHPQSCMPTCPT